MTVLEIVVGVALSVLVIAFSVWSVQVIPEGRAANVERLGRYHKTLRPGLHFVVPFLDRVKRVIDLRESGLAILAEAITKDDQDIAVDLTLSFQVIDTYAAEYEVRDYRRALEKLCTTTLRVVLANLNLEQSLAAHQQVSTELLDALERAASKWGIRVTGVEVEAINRMQESVNRITSEQARAIAMSGMSPRLSFQGQASLNSELDSRSIPYHWLTDPELQNLLLVNQAQIGVYHGIATKDAKRATRNSQIAMISGLIILIAGAATAIVTPNLTSKIVVGVITSLGSVLSSYIARTFLRSEDQAIRQLRYYFQQPVAASHMLTAERLSLKLDRNVQQDALRGIIKGALAAAIQGEQANEHYSVQRRAERIPLDEPS